MLIIYKIGLMIFHMIPNTYRVMAQNVRWLGTLFAEFIINGMDIIMLVYTIIIVLLHSYKDSLIFSLSYLVLYILWFNYVIVLLFKPLMDNLESQTYEVFEKDPVKYSQYQKVTYICNYTLWK